MLRKVRIVVTVTTDRHVVDASDAGCTCCSLELRELSLI